jgi:hypothetical protein
MQFFGSYLQQGMKAEGFTFFLGPEIAQFITNLELTLDDINSLEGENIVLIKKY